MKSTPANPSDPLTARELMRLPVEARRPIMERQARELAAFYAKDSEWREFLNADAGDWEEPRAGCSS